MARLVDDRQGRRGAPGRRSSDRDRQRPALYFKGSLPYSLVFDLEVTRVERPGTLAGRASGELEGTGVWTLTEEAGGVTIARYDWNVRTTRWWMNLLAPLARPLFKANHDLVMKAGANGICSLLGGVNGTCAWVSDASGAETRLLPRDPGTGR